MNSASFKRSDKDQREAYKSMNDSIKTFRKETKHGIGFAMSEEIPDDEDRLNCEMTLDCQGHFIATMPFWPN
jgi:hypothetical protein